MVRAAIGWWIGALLLAAVLGGCGEGDATQEAEDAQSNNLDDVVYFAPAVGCNLGAGVDTVEFNGTTYTQNTACTTDALAYYDASANTNVVFAVNNLFGLGSGSSLLFQFEWQATGTTGAFLAPPDLLLLQEGGTFSLCVFGIGAVNVTRRDGPGGLIEGDYAFYNVLIPWLCSVSSITGSFSIRREADVVSGDGTQAAPVKLTPGAAPYKGRIGEIGVSNYSFTATAATHTIATTGAWSDLLWAAYSNKPNLGDSALEVCDNASSSANEVCTLTGLTVGDTYYVQVINAENRSGVYRIAVN